MAPVRRGTVRGSEAKDKGQGPRRIWLLRFGVAPTPLHNCRGTERPPALLPTPHSILPCFAKSKIGNKIGKWPGTSAFAPRATTTPSASIYKQLEDSCGATRELRLHVSGLASLLAEERDRAFARGAETRREVVVPVRRDEKEVVEAEVEKDYRVLEGDAEFGGGLEEGVEGVGGCCSDGDPAARSDLTRSPLMPPPPPEPRDQSPSLPKAPSPPACPPTHHPLSPATQPPTPSPASTTDPRPATNDESISAIELAVVLDTIEPPPVATQLPAVPHPPSCRRSPVRIDDDATPTSIIPRGPCTSPRPTTPPARTPRVVTIARPRFTPEDDDDDDTRGPLVAPRLRWYVEAMERQRPATRADVDWEMVASAGRLRRVETVLAG
ncbi:hypothetical protein BDK51DRAFT_40019 [Blyttiomyces helicus]|uniref:Uncharacterized protein n=1 Tax=Blyttiomyces helicus TaxID=388810 RepID=A0A4P9WDM7_9FUNG|nr:hypothetical protein BDK51DRAFT_40019 [Blyttiomyces helicus]|eukprot:RKO89060.1 hypothetical protein BDK51DRAFT_40019 [Blyttiomyces helicus]